MASVPGRDRRGDTEKKACGDEAEAGGRPSPGAMGTGGGRKDPAWSLRGREVGHLDVCCLKLFLVCGHWLQQSEETNAVGIYDLDPAVCIYFKIKRTVHSLLFFQAAAEMLPPPSPPPPTALTLQ